MPSDAQDPIEPIAWRSSVLRFIDQTRLPAELCFVETTDYRTVAAAIRRLAIRGAPLIGIAAAYAMVLAAREERSDLRTAASELLATRPTAVNLGWAVGRMLSLREGHAGADRSRLIDAMETEAQRVHQQQREDDLRMGELGAALIPIRATVVTHCNAGSLATGGIGSALGVIKTAHRQGKDVRVLVDETRPLLQGARLTAWELERESIPYQLIVDAAAAGLIAAGAVQAVVVGADRIAANGDVANKVGTYGLALAAHAHGVPFYVVAPSNTVDADTPDGGHIAIERRAPDEVLTFAHIRTTTDATVALNPAFDVTPARYVTAIITERGVLRPPFAAALRGAMKAQTAVAP